MSDLAANLAQRYPLIWPLFTSRLKYSLAGIALVFVATSLSLYAVVIAQSDGLFTTFGPSIGGDFIVFYNAAKLAGSQQMSAIYDMDVFSAFLRDLYPGHGEMLFGWLYPPTMSMFIAPLGALPYLVSFPVWVFAFLGLFIATMRLLWRDNLALFIAIGSPAVFYSIITGQTGLLTGSLFALAVTFAGARPILAGLAAALLTVKPQFGLLLPLLFIVGGHWRAFSVAAAATSLLVGASILAYGIEPWRAFFDGLGAHGARMGADGGFPAFKLTSPFGAASVLGASETAAFAIHALVASAIIAATVYIWVKVKDSNIRLGVAGAAAALVTPYAFFYEAAFLVPPLFVIARHAADHGWLKGEKVCLMMVWAGVLLMPGRDIVPSFPTSFFIVFFAFAIALRRGLSVAHGAGIAEGRNCGRIASAA